MPNDVFFVCQSQFNVIKCLIVINIMIESNFEEFIKEEDFK